MHALISRLSQEATSVGVQVRARRGFDAMKEFIDAVHLSKPVTPEASNLPLQLRPVGTTYAFH